MNLIHRFTEQSRLQRLNSCTPSHGLGLFMALVMLLVTLGALSVVAGEARAQTPDATAGAPKVHDEPAPAAEDLLEEQRIEDLVDTEELVISAMKTATTLQESPAIISVITDQQIKDQRYRFLSDAVGSLPGFYPTRYTYGTERLAISRGIHQGASYMRDSVEMNDPGPAMIGFGEIVPLETIKRVEVISGPGGVLWGANSFLGVINVISKTADDLEGIEAHAAYGMGKGRPGEFFSYVMGGSKLLDDRIKILAHASFRTWREATLTFPAEVVMRSTSPQPQGPSLLVGPIDSDPARGYLLMLTGNAQVGPVSAYWHVPVGPIVRQANYAGTISRNNLDEDELDCTNPANKVACGNRVDPFRIGRYTQLGAYERYGILRYKDALLDGRFTLDARAYYIYFSRAFERYVSVPPSSVLPGGVPVQQPYNTHRGGASMDGTVKLLTNTQLIFGGEVFYDFLPEGLANFYASKATMNRMPFVCPPDADGRVCPVIVGFATNRLSSGLFLAGQSEVLETVNLSAGTRLQLYGGKRRLDPVVLFSGAAVWTFLPRWNLKATFAEGFRTPGLQKTDSNGEGVVWSGTPDLDVERSRSVQGEVNTVLLQAYQTVKRLALRIDYSYTWIDDYIEAIHGRYENSSRIGIHGVEFLAELQLKRGHHLALSYSFVDLANAELGKVRTYPNQWLSARSFFNLFDRRLFLSSSLMLMGSCEKVSRYRAQSAGPIMFGDMESGEPVSRPSYLAQATDVVMDRNNPVAIWNAGLFFLLPEQGLRFAFDVYNLLDTQGFESQAYMDLSAYTELVPSPREGIAFFATGEYTY